MVEEGKALADKPHIVISTPGRLADHINTGTNFSLKKLRFLVGEMVNYFTVRTTCCVYVLMKCFAALTVRVTMFYMPRLYYSND